jgi:hypothetical protein
MPKGKGSKLSFPGGSNVGEKRIAEGDKMKGFKKPGKSGQYIKGK